MSLATRAAAPADVLLILAFVRELADYERLAHEVDATEEGLRAALFGPNPRVFCDIAEWEGRPAGFALWFYNFSTFRGRHGIYLEDLFVRPAFRARGYGRELLEAVRARSEGRVEWAVLDWNEPAIGFYDSLGARPVDGWIRYRWDPQ